MPDFDGAGDPTLMHDQEAHRIGLGDIRAAPKLNVAVMRGWTGGRNTHLCTLGEEPAYLGAWVDRAPRPGFLGS